MNRQAKTSLSVYYRVGCHLCDAMIAALRHLQHELAFELELIDIDKDPDLLKRYDVDVPVVTLGTEVVCFHFFEENMVRQALQYG
ncbi:MAG: glutaredoxin family protein [Thiolinea sp.]